MRLSRLLEGYVEELAFEDLEILGMALDSRKVRPGFLFVAMAGLQEHGLAYAEQAIAEGAIAIIWESSPDVSAHELQHHVPVIEVANLRYQLGKIASRFYGHPSRNMTVLGVTGTDGKTSVAHILAEALDDEDLPAGYIGTLGSGLIGGLRKTMHTTPDAIALQGILAEMRDQRIRWVALEVSSHALDQGRVEGVRFDVAIFTNLTRDHLDYHGDLEAYAAAKRRLFQNPALGVAVLNLDDPYGDALADSLKDELRVLGFGTRKTQYEFDAVIAKDITFDSRGTHIKVQTPWGEDEFSSSLLGRFNVQNLLAALAAMLVQGVELAEALVRLSRVHTVPGRMESFGGEVGPLAIIDYAHTPAALEHVLTAAREHCKGELWCVFGCGGDRDQGKRPLMAAIAEQFADRVVVTNDNPRSEAPEQIINQIMLGFTQPSAVMVEMDRAVAIEQALSQAGSNDVVLIAGKGHETVQVIGDEYIYLSDRDEVARYLSEAVT